MSFYPALHENITVDAAFAGHGPRTVTAAFRAQKNGAVVAILLDTPPKRKRKPLPVKGEDSDTIEEMCRLCALDAPFIQDKRGRTLLSDEDAFTRAACDLLAVRGAYVYENTVPDTVIHGRGAVYVFSGEYAVRCGTFTPL